VVHTAALAHRAGDADEAEEVNTQGTLQLARSAADAGVDRFVFLSSIGVHGSFTVDAPFTEASPVCPQDRYARSKERAEAGLREISGRTGLRTTIIRPPLVYGPGAPGNFARLVRLVRTRIPLPFGGISNRRSLIAVGNLVDVLALCAFDQAADDEEFVVCDGEDLSTPKLLRLIAEGLGVPLRLIPAPASLLRLAAQALGRRQEADKLIQSLTIDASKLRERMHWRPRVSAAAAVVTAAREWPQDHRA
jgi:nucleoside-diphosphate-sugar epimerase